MSDVSATTEPWNVDRLLKWTRAHFQSKGLDEPRLKAELLLAHALGCKKIDLYARFDHVPPEQPLGKYRELVKSAARAEPIAYLIGRKEFYSLDFEVTSDVLIPRPETELVVEEALNWIKARAPATLTVCDIGTGSGCIAVTLAKRSPGTTVVATDVSPGALAVARRNADKHGVASSMKFIEADLLNLSDEAVPTGGFDLIVSNPPYVAKGHPESLAEDVRRYEPALALYGGEDGLEYYRRIAAGVRPVLRDDGGLIVEIGSGQTTAVKEILTRESRLVHLTTRRNGAGIERVPGLRAGIMTQLPQADFKRILIIKPSSPGDIIHALPVLRGLRQRFSKASISWLVATHFADLLNADPDLNEVIPFDRKRFGKLLYSPSALRDFIRFSSALHRRRFDLVIDLQGLFRSGFLAWVSGAKVRIGLPNSRELASFYHTHIAQRPADSEHAADFNWAVASMLQFDQVRRDFAIRVSDKDRTTADELLRSEFGDAKQPYVVLVPATRWETKCWPAKNFGQLARSLHGRFGMPSVLVGGNDDIARGQIAVEHSSGVARNLCGKTSLRELAVIIENAAVVVTGDSTPMHMAAAFNRPLVAIFGPTNAARTGPYRRSDAVVRLDLDCAPCYLRHLHQCRFEHACMEKMDVQRVADAVAVQLERAAA